MSILDSNRFKRLRMMFELLLIALITSIYIKILKNKQLSEDE